MYQGENLLTMPAKELNSIRGNRMSMIFQDPMTSLNPYLTIERQMTRSARTAQEHDAARAARAARDRHARSGADSRSRASHRAVSA